MTVLAKPNFVMKPVIKYI